MEAILAVEGLKKLFPIGQGRAIVAVNGVTFEIGRGETLGLVGESGSGKTTVGRCVLRLIEPDEGRIVFGGRDIARLPGNELRKLRPRMQLVFQEPFASLDPRWSVRQLIEEPLALEGRLQGPARTKRLQQVFTSAGIGASQLDRYPIQLTASEQQRVGIARAIVTHPDLVVLDEPTSNLDPSVRSDVLRLLVGLQQEYGASFLLISHDLTAVESISHRIAIMYLGHIVETGSMAAVRAKQLHPYSKALLSAVLYADPQRTLDPFVLVGEIPSAIDPPDECPLVRRCPFAEPRCSVTVPPLRELEPGHLSACVRSDEFVAAGIPAAVQALGKGRGSLGD